MSSKRLAGMGFVVVDGPFEAWANTDVARAILNENCGKYWDARISNRPLLPVIKRAEPYAGYDDAYTSEAILAALDAGQAVTVFSGPSIPQSLRTTLLTFGGSRRNKRQPCAPAQFTALLTHERTGTGSLAPLYSFYREARLHAAALRTRNVVLPNKFSPVDRRASAIVSPFPSVIAGHARHARPSSARMCASAYRIASTLPSDWWPKTRQFCDGSFQGVIT